MIYGPRLVPRFATNCCLIAASTRAASGSGGGPSARLPSARVLSLMLIVGVDDME
jgi:hypothetical protein